MTGLKGKAPPIDPIPRGIDQLPADQRKWIRTGIVKLDKLIIRANLAVAIVVIPCCRQNFVEYNLAAGCCGDLDRAGHGKVAVGLRRHGKEEGIGQGWDRYAPGVIANPHIQLSDRHVVLPEG